MKMQKSDFLVGIVIGAVVGAITVILFAPKSGKETRKDIKDYAAKMKDKAMKMKEEAMKKWGSKRTKRS